MELDILGQQPGLSNLYTQLTFCYSLSDESKIESIVDQLSKGLESLRRSFSWISGRVINDLPVKYGSYKVKCGDQAPFLIVKDCSASLPSWSELRQAGFPISSLDENMIAPINTFGAGSSVMAESSPVMAVQINIITGGLLLTFVTQHNVMDMTGMGQILYLLSKACHGIPFTEEEVKIGNLDRLTLIPLLDESYVPGPELDNHIQRTVHGNTVEVHEPKDALPSPCSWAYFNFSASSLSELKMSATPSLPSDCDYVSTDDVLTSFLWQSIMRVRRSRFRSGDVQSTLMRAVDPRRYLNIPESYPGLVQNMVYHTSTVDALIGQSVGTVAATLRHAVDPQTSIIGYSTQAFVTHYHRAADKSGISVTANFNPATDLMLSSWSKVDCSQLDFNLGLGKPECVRRPGFTPVEGLLYLMPKAVDGSVAAALCLRRDELDRLRSDQFFCKHAVYVG